MLAAFGYISGILSAICYIPYVRDIVRLKTKPERASWVIWLVLTAIAFFSQLAKGASDSLWLPGIQSLGVLIVFVLSIRFGVGGLTRRDVFALIAAGIGLVLWYFTQEPLVALFITIFIDAIGGLLTVLKSYQNPGSETLIAWVLSGTAGIFAILSVGSWDSVFLAYPVYISFINFAVAFAILLGFRKQRQMVL